MTGPVLLGLVWKLLRFPTYLIYDPFRIDRIDTTDRSHSHWNIRDPKGEKVGGFLELGVEFRLLQCSLYELFPYFLIPYQNIKAGSDTVYRAGVTQGALQPDL